MGAGSGALVSGTLSVTFPAGFFTAVTGMTHSTGAVTGNNFLFSQASVPNTTGVSVNIVQTDFGPGQSTVRLIVLGT